MGEAKAQTLTEKWDAFVNAEEDYIGGGLLINHSSPTDIGASFRRQAHGIYLSRVRAGIWNQEEAINAWNYYLEHDRAAV